MISPKLRKRFATIISVLFATSILSACGNNEQNVLQIPTRTVSVTKVESVSEATRRTLSGIVQAADQSEISFEVSGIVQTVNVVLGDTFAKGQTLASIDTKLFDLALTQSVSQLSEAQARLLEARTDYQRTDKLNQQGLISNAELDSARARFDALKDQVDVAKAQVSIATENLADTRIIAPFDGSVAHRLIEPSQLVSPNQPVFVLQGKKGLEISVLIPEKLINSVQPNDKVDISVSAFLGEKISGRIFEIGSQATTANAFPASIRINDTHVNLQVGMSTEVTFNVFRGDTEQFMVPISALHAIGNDSHEVFKVVSVSNQEFKIVAVPVRVNAIEKHAQGKHRAIVEGILSPADNVVKAGLNFVRAGETVLVAGSGTLLISE